MKKRDIIDFGKNAMGTVFLLAAAFFMCSTFLSIKTVFADPIAPTASRASSQSVRDSGRARATRVTSSRTTPARGGGNTGATRTVVSRNIARGVSPRVASTTRNVVARTGNVARVGVSGNAMMRASSGTTNYSILSSKLYTGNYSNIIDSTTGLISADAYSTCLDSYYTCMDEICTARSDTKGRCSCAGRATNFLVAEQALETANEELINLSGQLALLISTKGKDVSAAFQLTDAEKVMNCVSYKDAKAVAGTTMDESGSTISKENYMTAWCQAHMMYNTSECSYSAQPAYCSSKGDGANTFGFDIDNIDGSSSDIMASLKAWADAKDFAKQFTNNDDNGIYTAMSNLTGALSGLNINLNLSGAQSAAELDSLANTWGYELFEYAHNNVCGRVLDSCFNGIYEACGTPPTVTDSNNKSHNKCMNGQTSNCPFNYNSYISVTTSGNNQGDVKLNERGSTSATTSSSASCFGYSASSTSTNDPYAQLRGPVADARRSIMQKYLLDANAACDAYGAALQQTAQNIAYQKVAAQQALQQKRLEFYNEEQNSILSEYSNAISNMNECLSELYDCYTTQETSNTNWSSSRIKTYCMQIANVPHCYETMVCGTPGGVSTLQAVIDKADSDSCNASNVYSENTCRNIVTLTEILNGSYAAGKSDGSSQKYREQCLQNIGIDGVRNWSRTEAGTNWNND